MSISLFVTSWTFWLDEILPSSGNCSGTHFCCRHPPNVNNHYSISSFWFCINLTWLTKLSTLGSSLLRSRLPASLTPLRKKTIRIVETFEEYSISSIPVPFQKGSLPQGLQSDLLHFVPCSSWPTLFFSWAIYCKLGLPINTHLYRIRFVFKFKTHPFFPSPSDKD